MPGCWRGVNTAGWPECAVTMAVTSAASVKITSAVMSSAAPDCQPAAAAASVRATVPCGYGLKAAMGSGPAGRSAVSAHSSAYVRAA
jgi:hypothetical protein